MGLLARPQRIAEPHASHERERVVANWSFDYLIAPAKAIAAQLLAAAEMN